MKEESPNSPSKKLDHIVANYLKWTSCFTDGSKTDNKCEAVYLVDTELVSSSFLTISSVVTTELIAIYQCLLCFLTSSETQFLLFSDSKQSFHKIGRPMRECSLTSHIKYLLHHITVSVLIRIAAHVLSSEIEDAAVQKAK